MTTNASTQTPSARPTEPEVIVRRAGHLGHLILNRPKALNSLTKGMMDTVLDTLDKWCDDDGVRTVLVSGAGERGLCAGGDVVTLYRHTTAGRPELTDEFFGVEYTMNAAIADFPKPYVAFMDGIVVGGGVGISAHGSHRVVTERTRLGMPETGIGFFPDNWLLSRAPSGFGTHMALTGAYVTGADAVQVGLADHFVPSEALPALALALEDTHAEEAIQAVTIDPPAWPLAEHRRWIDTCYGKDTAEEIIEALQSDGDPAAAEAAAQIRAKSPTAVKVAFAALRRAQNIRSLHDVLRQDYRVVHHMIRGHDTIEGIRAQVIDKDRNPQWSPAILEAVSADTVTAHFAPVDGDLELSPNLSALKEALS
jgi:enoyl-CoA hydratase